MNINDLFELQAKLDAHIEKEHPRQPGEDRLAKKILALQVELGELCNCWRGFKFWSEDQKPRTDEPIECETCDGWGSETDPYGICMSSDKCENCSGTGFVGSRNPLLEEYVDCLHFILSIGLDINVDTNINYGMTISRDVTEQFFEVYRDVLEVKESVEFEFDGVEKYRDLLVPDFLGLGKMLGFTWEQIEQAYLAKNKINHLRQELGY